MSTPSGIFRVYIASALGFSVPSRIFYRRTLIPTLVGNGFEVLDPWTPSPEPSPEAPAAIGRRLVRLIARADAVLALLDGADLDGGTALEVGYAAGCQLPVVVWRSDRRRFGETGGVLPLPGEHLIELNGGSIHTDLGQAIEALIRLRRQRPRAQR